MADRIRVVCRAISLVMETSPHTSWDVHAPARVCHLPATDLAVLLHMPDDVTKHLHKQERRLFFDDSDECQRLVVFVERLGNRTTAESARIELHELLGADPDGFGMLCCMLRAAAAARSRYQRLGIGEDVFEATMGCFTRFVREYHRSYGRYGFDRGFWTIRQLSLRLFRLGELEFELADQPYDVPKSAPGSRVINVHIPSDAHLNRARCVESCRWMVDFVSRFFQDWSGLPVMCTSWLLSPALGELLPQSSHIIQFQRMFDIVGTDPNAQDWREWVFQRNPAPIGDLPERTSLQRGMKAYLLNGGQVGTGTGVLRDLGE